MSRLDPLPIKKMSDVQRNLHDLIAKQRSGGEVRGPFGVMLRAPDVCERVAEMVNHMLSDSRVPLTLKELAIIVIARQYTAQYEWFVHARRARECGLSDAIISAIEYRRRPQFEDEKELIVYNIAMELVEQRQISDALYTNAIKHFDEAALVELVALIGFYIMIAVFLVAFDVDVPDTNAMLLNS